MARISASTKLISCFYVVDGFTSRRAFLNWTVGSPSTSPASVPCILVPPCLLGVPFVKPRYAFVASFLSLKFCVPLFPYPCSIHSFLPLPQVSVAASHVPQQMCSHRYSCLSMIMTQLQRPCSFHSFPHQQQFQHPPRASNGHWVPNGHMAA